MRKLVCMLLAALLLVATMTTAFAAGDRWFDMSVFDMQDYEMNAAGSDYFFINHNEYLLEKRDFAKIKEISLVSSRYYSSMMSYIYASTSNHEVIKTSLILYFKIYNDNISELMVHTIDFTIGDVTYSFTIDADCRDAEATSSNDAYCEEVYIYIDESNRHFMDAFCAAQEPVPVVAYGQNATVEMKMGLNIISATARMYDDFVAANGFVRNIIGTEMTVQSKLDKFLGKTTKIVTPMTNYAARTNEQWMSTDENRALLASLLAYDLFSSNPNWADVLGYAYGTCYTGMTETGEIHLVIQTTLNTYYIVYDGTGATVSVKTGAEKMTDSAAAMAIMQFAGVSNEIPSDVLLASMGQQAAMVAEFNANGVK